MNTPLRRLATVVLVMFVGLMASATWVQYFQADRLNNDSRNVRSPPPPTWNDVPGV